MSAGSRDEGLRSCDLVVVRNGRFGAHATPGVVAAAGLVFPHVTVCGVAELTLLAAALAAAMAQGAAGGLDEPVVLAGRDLDYGLRLNFRAFFCCCWSCPSQPPP